MFPPPAPGPPREARLASPAATETAHLGPGCDIYTAAVVLTCDVREAGNGCAYWKNSASDWHRDMQGGKRTDLHDTRGGRILSRQLALVGTIYGQQAGRSMMRAIVLGPRSMGALERAAEVESANPRVLLLQGMTALHTPSAFGGSRDKAEHLLRRSLDEFSREPRTKAWPNWGRFDAHAWLGQVLRRKGDLDGARAEYQKALAIAPESPWLRTVLLPALERASKQ